MLRLQEILKNIYRSLVATLLCSFIFYNSFAQAPSSGNTYPATIKGIVIDSANQVPLSYVTLVIKQSGKPQLTKHTFTKENGYFEIKGLNRSKKYQLIITYVGFKPKILQIPDFESSILDLETIKLAPIAILLQEVQVVTSKPLIEHHIDKLIYHIEADPEANTLNSLDMLRKVPHLSVDADDNLLLNGNANIQILVNGKRSSMFSGNYSEVLKNLPAYAIKNVEVITDPSAKYDAGGGGGVINILTQKKRISGYNGSLNLSAGSPGNYNGGASLMGSAGKFSFSGRNNNSYIISPVSSSNFFREYNSHGNKLEQKGEGNSISKYQSWSAELPFELSPFDLITPSFSMNKNESSSNYNQLTEQLNPNGNPTEIYRNLNRGINNGNGKDIILDYQRSFKNNERRHFSQTLSLLRNDYLNTTDFTLQPLLNYTGRENTTDTKDQTKEYIFQSDYTQPLGKQLLELGIKSSLQENSSLNFYKDLESGSGVLILDPRQSNSFNYQQYIHAAYASMYLQKNKWGLRTGLRLEEMRLKADFSASGTHATQLNRNLFPNITLTHLPKENSSIKISYNQRIERPILNYLNPFVDVTDPLNISYGNPDLDAAINHNFQFEFNRYLKKSTININLFHQFTNNTILEFTTLSYDSIARTTYGNLGQNQVSGLILSANATLANKLIMNLSGSSNYIRYSSVIEGKKEHQKGFTYSIISSNSYRFGKGWRANGNLSYNSANILLQGRSAGYAWSTVSLNKQFLKNQKASISFTIMSPFQKYRRNLSEVHNPAFYQLRETSTVIRQYSLAINYRFGKLH